MSEILWYTAIFGYVAWSCVMTGFYFVVLRRRYSQSASGAIAKAICMAAVWPIAILMSIGETRGNMVCDHDGLPKKPPEI